MTEMRRNGLEEILGAARKLLAQASDEIKHDSHDQGLSRTISYSLSLLNAAMSRLDPAGIACGNSRYCTPLDVMEENERLQTLVLKAALEQRVA